MDHYEIIERSLLRIESSLDQPLSLDSMADSFNMSKFYFHRLFSAMMGCSLNSYIRSRRLNASLPLLRSGRLSITDIAYQLNFGTPSSFTRAFKDHYGIAPSSLKEQEIHISQTPVPPVVRRPIKNINGDIVADFTLTEFQSTKMSGIAFEVDLAADDYKTKIRSHAQELLKEIDTTVHGPCYVVYSNCQPDSTQFKVLFGIPYDVRIDKPFYFTVDVPQLFCAKFKYFGDLLDIGDVLKTDYARFLKISRQEPEDSHIELIQAFDDVHHLESTYHIYAPVKKLSLDSDDE
ncbi:AraC family transcriptional regulator [Paenibacillus sp.]|uniref:helix-turn-helix transcriptional regulator n=1 Tax=Paenibacillus sp. TaxID=58172 RepID=UPI002D62C69D|nr:AraC family transcriptional regulator [Paenibacillus sp.]HZG84836.1 AraC family transcriptional regulator [Paenibacillus sp.]